MRRSDDKNLILLYISLAAGCFVIGTGFTFGLLAFCAYYEIDLTLHWWLLALPLTATLVVNVLLIEAYQKLTRR